MTKKVEISKVLSTETWYQDEEMSVAFVVLSGLGNMVVNRHSDMFYEVVAGSGQFVVGDSCVFDVETDHTIYIPAGTQYQDSGDLVMIATATPPFNLDDVSVLA